jgi:Predicted membrane protein
MGHLNRFWTPNSDFVHVLGTIAISMRARLVSFLMGVALVIPAAAADRRGGESLDRVLPQVRHAVPGTFYDAEGPFFSPDGQPSYRLKWMTPDGRLIWFSVDARSGQILHGVPGMSDPRSGPPRGNFRDENSWNNREGRENWSERWDRGSERPREDIRRDNGWDRRGNDTGWGRRGSDNSWNRGPDRQNDRQNDRPNDRQYDQSGGRGGWGSNDRGNNDRGNSNSGRGADHHGSGSGNSGHDGRRGR